MKFPRPQNKKYTRFSTSIFISILRVVTPPLFLLKFYANAFEKLAGLLAEATAKKVFGSFYFTKYDASP